MQSMDSVEAIAAEIIAKLVGLEPEDRETVFNRIEFNGIFCVHCGYGSVASPNVNCQCTNDD